MSAYINPHWRRAAISLGIPLDEYISKRQSGFRMCCGCHEWHEGLLKNRMCRPCHADYVRRWRNESLLPKRDRAKVAAAVAVCEWLVGRTGMPIALKVLMNAYEDACHET